MSDNNIHEGHRKRMIQKYLKNGTNAFEEHELLEMLLFILLPRINTNTIAHRLLNRFGLITDVFNATIEELESVDGIGRKTAIDLKFLGDMVKHIHNQRGNTVTFNDSTSIIDFCIDHFKGDAQECLSFFMLDAKGTLLFTERVQMDNANEISFDMKNVIKKAVIMNVGSIIMAHNHPSGPAIMSNNDITATRRLNTLLSAIDIKLHDHIIVSGKEGFSMRGSGGVSDIWY